MLTWITAGESHGEVLTGILDGVPQGVAITTADIEAALARRRLGYGRGARQAFEKDEVRIVGGVRHGVTTGAPVAIEIANSEWPKWRTVMSADPVDPKDLLVDAGTGDEREIARNRRLTRPRPGHADLAGMLKYNLYEARPILERASARETAMKVALGAVASAILRQIAGIETVSHVVQIGEQKVFPDGVYPTFADTPVLDRDPVRCFDSEVSKRMVAAIDEAKSKGDTIGGVVEVLAYQVPVGLGSHVQTERKLDAALAGALMGIQAVKGVEIGDGFETAGRLGSKAHDEIIFNEEDQLTRTSNRAGGIEGGMSDGQPIRVRVAYKPISTVPKALRTIDMDTKSAAGALHQRSDTCATVPGAVIAQAVVELVLARFLLEKTGGDSVFEAKQNLSAYLERISERITP